MLTCQDEECPEDVALCRPPLLVIEPQEALNRTQSTTQHSTAYLHCAMLPPAFSCTDCLPHSAVQVAPQLPVASHDVSPFSLRVLFRAVVYAAQHIHEQYLCVGPAQAFPLCLLLLHHLLRDPPGRLVVIEPLLLLWMLWLCTILLLL